MLIKMTKRATAEEVVAIEDKLHDWGFKTGKMIGEEITLIGVYGDITRLPTGEVQEMGGVESLIPISRAYKRVAQKGSPGNLIHQTVWIGNIEVGGDAVSVIAGPCSVESETQIMEAARIVKEAGGKALRGGVVKYRSSPYSGWEGIGSSSEDALRTGLKFIVKAGREFALPTVVEVHPNPLIAKSDGFQGLFPEQVKHLVTACEQVWETRKRIEPLYVPSALLERDYEDRVAEDKRRFFGAL